MALKSKTPWNDEQPINDMTVDIQDVPNIPEAPDPLDFAQQTQQASTLPALPAVAGTDSTGQALLMIAQMLQEIRAKDAGASSHLQAIEKLLADQERIRPHENLFNPPLFSAFNPKGERDHPRADLPYKIFWVGHQEKKDQLTSEEIDLYRRLKPGAYRVTKANGRTIPFTVKAKIADNGEIESLSIHFPCKGPENRGDHASKLSYLREVLEGRVSVEDLYAQIADLKTQITAHQQA